MGPMIFMHFIELPATWFTTVYMHTTAWHSLVSYGGYSSIDSAKIACRNDEICILINQESSYYSLSSNETNAHGRGFSGTAYEKGKRQ